MTRSFRRASIRAAMGQTMRLRSHIRASTLGMMLVATPALAQKASANEAATLFNTARDLMAQQRFVDACPLLSRSDQLMPAVGTALNLGLCSEKIGHTASAILAYKEAMTLAEQMGSEEKKRLQYARERVAALEPKLVRLQLAVAPSNPPDIQIKRDGIAVDRSQWSTAVPVDPEDHAIEASALGKVTWRATINAATEGGSVVVTVPVLEDAPVLSAGPVLPGASPSPGSAAPSHTGRILGELGLLVLGVGGLAAGGVLALGAKAQFDDGQSLCTTSGCPSQTQGMEQSAVTRGDVATVMVGVGAAALIGAGVLWLTTPSAKVQTGSASPGPTVAWGPSLGGLRVTGVF
jgi:hypothetical protein